MRIDEALADPHRVVVMDGGLATELERHGHDLNHPLWSAKLLLENRDDIKQINLDFLNAGSNIVTTATYQATYQGLAALGYSQSQATEMFRQAIQVGIDARSAFIANHSAKSTSTHVHDVWIAGSLGPYGAYLHDGSEYRGDYGLSEVELTRFHEERFETVAALDIDVIGFETFPSLLEARAIASLLRNSPKTLAWLSFSCKDPMHSSFGDQLADCARFLDSVPNIIAVGANCMSPDFVPTIIQQLRRGTEKGIAVYPNTGLEYSAVQGTWKGDAKLSDWRQLATEWRELGATMIGGCCRVQPADIREIAKAVA